MFWINLNKFQGCFGQLYVMGMKVEEEVLAVWLLDNIPDSWEIFRVSLANATSEWGLTMEYVKRGVINENIEQHHT